MTKSKLKKEKNFDPATVQPKADGPLMYLSEAPEGTIFSAHIIENEDGSFSWAVDDYSRPVRFFSAPINGINEAHLRTAFMLAALIGAKFPMDEPKNIGVVDAYLTEADLAEAGLPESYDHAEEEA